MLRVVSAILVIYASIYTGYFVGANDGFNLGKADKQNDDILRGIVVCKYKDKWEKRTCRPE